MVGNLYKNTSLYNEEDMNHLGPEGGRGSCTQTLVVRPLKNNYFCVRLPLVCYKVFKIHCNLDSVADLFQKWSTVFNQKVKKIKKDSYPNVSIK